jgi:integrase
MAETKTSAPASATSGAGKSPTPKAPKWVERWGYEISPKAAAKCVFRLRDGGYLCRARVKAPDGKQRVVFRAMKDAATADDARAWLVAELERVKAGPVSPAEALAARPTFSGYVRSLLERKVNDGRIKSAHTRGVLASILTNHLLPVFGDVRVDELRRAMVMAWRDKVAARIAAGEVSPHTANGWWSALRAIINEAVAEYELDRNPGEKIQPFDTSEHPAHTREDPNSLTGEEFEAFTTRLREMFPQHYAMAMLGFVTGLRPSTLRPLRRAGPDADVLWEERAILIRRSHTRRQEVMGTTKTGFRQRVGIPEALVELLRAHVDALPLGPMLDSELLFPSVYGGFRAPCVLQKPFNAVAKAIGLRKRITPKGMRRTFQDLTRAAEVSGLVVRSISGHVTEEMQEHYSTPLEREQRDAVARVIHLADAKARLLAARGAAASSTTTQGTVPGTTTVSAPITPSTAVGG